MASSKARDLAALDWTFVVTGRVDLDGEMMSAFVMPLSKSSAGTSPLLSASPMETRAPEACFAKILRGHVSRDSAGEPKAACALLGALVAVGDDHCNEGGRGWH